MLLSPVGVGPHKGLRLGQGHGVRGHDCPQNAGHLLKRAVIRGVEGQIYCSSAPSVL